MFGVKDSSNGVSWSANEQQPLLMMPPRILHQAQGPKSSQNTRLRSSTTNPRHSSAIEYQGSN